VLAYIVLVAASQPGFVGTICTLFDSIASRCPNHTGSIGALKIGFGAVLPLGNTSQGRFIGSVWAILLAIADIILRYAVAIVALKLGAITFRKY